MASSSSDDEDTIDTGNGLYGNDVHASTSGNDSSDPMARLAPTALPAAALLPLYLRQPSHWAREQVEQCANSELKEARQRLLFDEGAQKAPVAERQQAYQDYLALVGQTATPPHSSLFAWEQTLPMDSLAHERLFCLHNLASLTMRQAASGEQNAKEARQQYQEAALLWHLVGEQAANVPTEEGEPREARTEHAQQWQAVATALAQHCRALEVHQLDASRFGDAGTHRFMVGQAMALARERWQTAKKAIKNDAVAENALAVPIALLSHMASAGHYAQWARFHGVPEEEGGREHAGCEFTVTAAIALLKCAASRLEQADTLRKQDNSRLEKKLTRLTTTLQQGGGGGKKAAQEDPNAVLKKWLADEQRVVKAALQERQATNRSVTMQPDMSYRDVALEQLMRSRDHDEDAEERTEIATIRDRLSLPPPWEREEALRERRESLGILLAAANDDLETTSTAVTAVPAEHGESDTAGQHQQQLLQQRVIQTLAQTRQLWKSVRSRMVTPYNAYIDMVLRMSEQHLHTSPPKSLDELQAIKLALLNELQPFCRLFLNAATLPLPVNGTT